MDKIYHDAEFRTKNLPPDSAAEEAKLAAAVKVGSQNGLNFTQQEFSDVQSVKAFWKKASQDESLQKQLKAAGAMQNRDQMTNRVVEIARTAGYSFPATVVKEISTPALELVHDIGSGSKSELNKEELTGVVGGATSFTSTSFASLTLDASKLTSPIANRSYDTVMCPW
jgi:predicted ribosomally synthesized peptide with nif11-like leader